MQKIETIGGSIVWMAVALVMALAALEPVELRANGPVIYAAADCATSCETPRG